LRSEQESQQNQRSTNTTPAPVLGLRTASYCTENEGTPRSNLKLSHSDGLAERFQQQLGQASERFQAAACGTQHDQLNAGAQSAHTPEAGTDSINITVTEAEALVNVGLRKRLGKSRCAHEPPVVACQGSSPDGVVDAEQLHFMACALVSIH